VTHETPLVDIECDVAEHVAEAETSAPITGPWWGHVSVGEEQTRLYPRRAHSVQFYDGLTRHIGVDPGFVGPVAIAIAAVVTGLATSVAAAALAGHAAPWYATATVIAIVVALAALLLGEILHEPVPLVQAVAATAVFAAIPWFDGPGPRWARFVAAAAAAAAAVAALTRARTVRSVLAAALVGGLVLAPGLGAYGLIRWLDIARADLHEAAQFVFLAAVSAALVAIAWNMKGWGGLVAALVPCAAAAICGAHGQTPLGVALGAAGVAAVANYVLPHMRRYTTWQTVGWVAIAGAGTGAAAGWRWPAIDWSGGPIVLSAALLAAGVVPALIVALMLTQGLAPGNDDPRDVAARRVGADHGRVGLRARLAGPLLGVVPRSAHLSALFESFGTFKEPPRVKAFRRKDKLPLYRSFLEVDARREDGIVTVEFTCRAVTGVPRDREPHAELGINTPIEDHWVVRWPA
jgi:hypothetical protein